MGHSRAAAADDAVGRVRTLLAQALRRCAPAVTSVPEDALEDALPEELCRVLLAAGPDASDDDFEDFLGLARHALGGANDDDRRRWATVDGVALLAAQWKALFAVGRTSPTPTAPEDAPRPHMVLLLDRALQELPWESLPVLRNVPTSRVPSLAFLQARLQERGISPGPPSALPPTRVYYVLNPSKDLAQTQERFQGAFSRSVARRPPKPMLFSLLILLGGGGPRRAFFCCAGGGTVCPIGQAWRDRPHRRKCGRRPSRAMAWLCTSHSAAVVPYRAWAALGRAVYPVAAYCRADI